MTDVDVRALLAEAEATGETAEMMRAARMAARSGEVADLHLLAEALQVAFRFEGSLPLLTEALEHAQRAAGLLTEDDPDLPLALSGVGMIQTRLAEETGDPELAGQALETGRRALALLPAEDPNRPGMLSNFSFQLLGAARRTGETVLVTEAIGHSREAVELGGDDDPHRGAYQSNLALGLGILAEETGSPEAAAGAVDADRTALALVPDGHAGRARLLSNVQASLTRLAFLTGDASELAEAARIGAEAVAATRPEDPRRPARLLNLADTHQQIHRYTGSREALAQAMALSREAVATVPAGHGDRPDLLNNLAGLLRLQYSETGAEADLREAAGIAREATETGADHPESPDYSANLGLILFALYQVTGESQLLLDSIHAQRTATETARTGLSRAQYHGGLAETLHMLHHRTGRDEPLAEAVTAARAAVAEAPEGHPVRATAWALLGVCLRSSYRLSEDPGELAESVAAAREAVEAAADDRARAYLLSNLAAAMVPVGAPAEPEIVAEAAGYARQAAAVLPDGHPSLASVLANLTNVLLAGPDSPQAMSEAAEAGARAARMETAPPRVRIRAARNWGRAARRGGDTVASLIAYQQAVDLLVRVAPRDLERDDREFGLGEIGGLAGEAAAAALDEDQPELAVELLERSRGVLFGQLIDARGAAPATSLPGPVVILNAAPHRCDALVLDGGPVRLIELPGLTEQVIMDRANTLLTLTGPAAATKRSYAANRKLRQDVRDVLAWQWDAVASRIVPESGGGRMWWCPVGAMAFLPWHAAGHHDGSGRSVLDRVVSSHIPTLRALNYASRPVPQQRPALVIGAAAPDGETPLTRVAEETELVRSALPGASTPLLDATRAQVLKALPRHGIAHFACHCESDWLVPSDSRLLLMDGPLTVAELSGLDLPHATLAYLSACATTRTNLRLADEAVQVTAGLLMAGFRQVIGTLWKVGDNDGLTVSTAFYTGLRGDPDRAAEVLHTVVRALRDEDPVSVSRWAAYIHAGI
ncbi:CHAT domain-containing protein [Actinoplanes derwentensis]|uniref:CHAT domain-containing protein n=1 Tax=Actinoplanes derwentensis TaxID=113562 RepID=A0A1H1Y2Y1_9ACTN|nr:CHAT domain-containing protein [Actinoplanes derwentensis]GID86743.1 hypothetical protein Ade03nite_56670 [Actinoplanes derwentensis]SDT15762.1 CHAT domain-containing protein [Actinoplanes derwentensis]